MAGLKSIELNPKHKRWLLWGLAFAALALVVVVFGGETGEQGDSAENRQETIQGIIESDETRDLSIGALNERLERQKEEKKELRDTVSRLSDQLDRMEKRQQKLDELEARNTEMAGQLEDLKEDVAEGQAQGDKSTGQGATESRSDDTEPSDPNAEGRQRRAVDTREAFEREPAPRADADGSGQSAGGPPEIRTISSPDSDSDAKRAEARKNIENYMQTGSIVSGRLLSGLDAPTNQGAQENTVPVTLRVKKNAVLPNRHRSDVRECFVLLEGYGELSSERVHLRSNTLSCVRDNDTVLEVPMRAYAVGEDGKTGLRGRLVSKQGAVIARSMLSGFASGVSKAFKQSPVPTIQTGSQVGGEQTFQEPNIDAASKSGAVSGASQALDQVANFYLDMAKQMFPVLEVNPGRPVDLVITKGLDLRTGPSESEDSNQ